MRALRSTRNNLISVNFGKQEELDREGGEQLSAEQSENVTCENGVCTLNWSPTGMPAKKAEAA